MRHKLWLLSAFAVAATLSLGAGDADAAPRTAKAKAEKSQASTQATLDTNYRSNTKHCKFDPPAPDKKWGWKTARLTAEYTKSEDGHYVRTVLPGQKNEHVKLPIASIAKFMATEVIFDLVDQKKFSLDKDIEVTRESLCFPYNYFAVKGLPANIETIKASDALTHMTKLSSNTMALNLAIAAAGSEEAFVALMNAKAAEWGMKDTQFLTVHGLPQGDRKSEFTTAEDMAMMAEHIFDQFNRYKKYTEAPLKPWTLKEDKTKHPGKYQLSTLGSIFKTATIDECASLLTLIEIGDHRLVDVELCGNTQSRFQNAIAAVKGGVKRFGEMVLSPAIAADKPPRPSQLTAITPVSLSSHPDRSANP